MKKTVLLFVVSFLLSSTIFAQESSLSVLEATPGRQPWLIKGVSELGGQSAIAHTSDAAFRTNDGGETWQKLALPLSDDESIGSVLFRDNVGYALATDARGSLVLIKTTDGGRSWTKNPLDLPEIAAAEAAPETAELTEENGTLKLSFRIATSSNFEGYLHYLSPDGGRSWRFGSRVVDLATEEEASATKTFGNWSIVSDGKCHGFKSGCVQETRLYFSGKEATPTELKDLFEAETRRAKQLATPMFATPPGGSTRISLQRGYDKCQAGSIAQLQIWWNTSHFYDMNIYMSGRARACPNQPFTNNPAWIDQVSSMGWGLIPTIVGYQSPCTTSSTVHRFSHDPAVAEQQGRGEADIAVADAVNIGLTQGSVLYYDMEQYNVPNPDTLGCRAATVAFLKGWTERIHELGYISGTYGSPRNAQEDWINLPPASRMDAIWMARWDNVMSVWIYLLFPNFPTNVWNNHQRIKQWQAPHNETWGGVTFNIDGNIADGPVAGIAVPKNKNADFDGDGKTDISVFRPDTGDWFVLRSSNSTYSAVRWGIATDIIAPGDYDGDGKTDHAVWRPSDGTWHISAKGGIYITRTWGADGDIPVPSDFNGDGKTDTAVFRPSTGTWFILNSDSLNTHTTVTWGTAGDKPIHADYDGDGKTDIGVYRPSTGEWHILRSSDSGYSYATWGSGSDQPVQGDYDGDNKADIAVFREGTWYLLQSTAGFEEFTWGVAGDVRTTGDFDGDGHSDLTVYRPSNGTWYIRGSQAGFISATWGNATDLPVTNAYLTQ